LGLEQTSEEREKMRKSQRLFNTLTFGTVTLAALVIGTTNLSATPIPYTGDGVTKIDGNGGLVAVTSATPCISFAGLSTCGAGTTVINNSPGPNPGDGDPFFGNSGTIKDIGTTFPISAFKTVAIAAGGTADWDLENIVAPSGFPACTFTTTTGACSTGIFLFTQNTPSQVTISFTTNEEGYVGTNATFTPYQGIFQTTLTGPLVGCTIQIGQACQDNIADKTDGAVRSSRDSVV
jgi:hypothetical protein